MPDGFMNRKIKKVCVYCGSGTGHNPLYAEAADTLGSALAEHEIGLVYGGGSNGLMGAVAKSVLRSGGHVTGIIPDFLASRERLLRDAQDVIVTENMHERKQLMFEKSDGFVALPGGVGTLEELVEQLTWSQLGQHRKPIVLADIDGFWQPLIKLFDHMRGEAFIREGLELSLAVVDKAEGIVPTLAELAEKYAPAAEEESIPAKF